MLREFFYECRRVLRVTRKPGKSEYLTVAKVTGLGIALIGLVGFVVQIIATLLGISL